MNFPQRLYHLITDAAKLGVDDVISWHPSGAKFFIHDQKEFTSRVLPKVFKQSKFSSFRRQLNAYGFERESTDPTDAKTFAIFSHKSFHRDELKACTSIKRRRMSGGPSLLPIVSSSSKAAPVLAISRRAAPEKEVLKKTKPCIITAPSTNLKDSGTREKEIDRLLKLANAAESARVSQKTLHLPPMYDESTLLKLREMKEVQRIHEDMRRKISMGLFNNSAAINTIPSPYLSLLPQASSLDLDRATVERALTLDRALLLSGYKLVKL